MLFLGQRLNYPGIIKNQNIQDMWICCESCVQNLNYTHFMPNVKALRNLVHMGISNAVVLDSLLDCAVLNSLYKS